MLTVTSALCANRHVSRYAITLQYDLLELLAINALGSVARTVEGDRGSALFDSESAESAHYKSNRADPPSPPTVVGPLDLVHSGSAVI